VDGRLVSSNEVGFPHLEGSESMQVSLGGFHGRMGSFHFFNELLTPAAIYSLYSLGAGPYAAPAHHVVTTGLVSVFPQAPAATTMHAAEHAAPAHGSPAALRDEQHALVPQPIPPNIVHHRIVSRVLLSHSPLQTSHELCLPYAWGDDWHLLDPPTRAGATDMVPGSAAGCAAHTLRLPGVGVRHRRHNSQRFVDIGGLKLLFQSLSPTYAGALIPSSDEEVCETLTLISLAVAANAHNASQLLEIDASTLKHLLLEPLRVRHKTAQLLQGLKRLLLVVASVDRTSEQAHFASFVSYLLLDLTYWRSCSTHVLSLVVHLLKLLVLHNPRPFVLHSSIGVARIVDCIRVLTHRFFAPEAPAAAVAASASSAAPTPQILSPVARPSVAHLDAAAAMRSAADVSSLSVPLQINTDVLSPPLSAMGALSPTSPPAHALSPGGHAAHPSASELDLVRTLLSVAVELAKQSAGTPHLESHVVSPLLHLLQLSTVSSSTFPASLLVEFLSAFLRVIPLAPPRTLACLYKLDAAHVFLRMLFDNDENVRTLALRCLQHINVHLVRLNKLERQKEAQKPGSGAAASAEIMQLQSDIAAAIKNTLALHVPLSSGEQDALFQLLMGQVPDADGHAERESAASPSPGQDGASPADASKRRSHRGLSLETGLAFCHSAYLSVALELGLSSPLPVQSKLLLDLLTLLRSNPHNVLVMASLFWQRLLLPYLSKLKPVQAASPPSMEEGAAPAAAPASLTGQIADGDSGTIDVLVYQLLNLLLVHCMTNESKGWQVLDQVLWCLDERERARMLSVLQQQAQGAGATEADLASTTVSEQWRVQVAIFNRLFQSLHKSVSYLSLPAPGSKPSSGSTSSSGGSDGSSHSMGSFALHSDSQVSNLRRNIPAVLELTEWLLFHSPHSFLTTASQPGVTRRTSSNVDRGDIPENRRRTESMSGAARPTFAPGGPQPDSSPNSSTSEDDGTPSLMDSMAAAGPSLPTRMSVISPQGMGTASPSSFPAATATASATVASITRASLRGHDEPLTEVEVELLAGLLTSVVKQYPLPERRQDVLRVMFRYLLVVLPNPLCASLCPLICDSVLELFTDRIGEANDKNNRLIALSLHLLKVSMEAFMRREENVSVEQIKGVMSAIYSRYGPQVFMTPAEQAAAAAAKANAAAAAAAAITPRVRSNARTSIVSTSGAAPQTEGQPPAELDLLSGPAAPSQSADEASTGSDDAAVPSAPEEEQAPQETPLEQLLFHLYSGESHALVDSTQHVFEQHSVRLGYMCEVRARQVAESIAAYLKKQAALDSRREKNFALNSTETLRRVNPTRPFLSEQLTLKRGRPTFRTLGRDKKHEQRMGKLLKHFHYAHANSRPRTALPALLPPKMLEKLQALGDAFSPYVRASDLTASQLNYSTQCEFWKLDTTESPTRMRRLVKKNFRGSSHASASANAATGKTAILAPQALDLANSLKSAVVKQADGAGANSGVDADSMLGEMQTPTNAASNTQQTASTTQLLSSDPSAALEESDADAGDAADGGDSDDNSDDEAATSSSSWSSRRSSKYLLTQFCVMITPERKYVGRIKIAQHYLAFAGTEMLKPEVAGANGSGGTGTATASASSAAAIAAEAAAAAARKPLKQKRFRWPLRSLRMVLPRLYLLRESALEIFLNNFKNFFFNFTPLDDETVGLTWQGQADSKDKSAGAAVGAGAGTSSSGAAAKKPPLSKKLRSGREQRNDVYKLLCSLCPEMQFELSPGRRLLKSGIMRKWQRGEISNFDYLQHLNTCAGRSYNDINQYPVFPWILTDYKSSTIDLDDPRVYRDLSKPIGALNEDRFEIYAERYATFDDPDIPAFHYGSHYSSAGIALYYLLRMEPFTSLAINLQGGHYDLADRLFESIQGAWNLSYTNVGDVKELIPEFFYCPEFLRNLNGLDLGTKQDKTKLGDVVLPPWAKGSPEEFVRINRAALESEYVSQHLHEWIDLIFGFKQKGKAAVDADNVFFYLTYAGAVDIDSIESPALRKATEDQVTHFGQTPAQLLSSPHPARLPLAERQKIAAGNIALPAKLNPTFSSQLIHYYQPPLPLSPAKDPAAIAAQKRAAAKAKLSGSKTMLPGSMQHGSVPPGGAPLMTEDVVPAPAPTPIALVPDAHHGHTFESERASIVAQVPTTLCFAAHNVVIGVTDDLALQTHGVQGFIAQPAIYMPPPEEEEEDAAGASSNDNDAERTADAEGRAEGQESLSRRASVGNAAEAGEVQEAADGEGGEETKPVDPLADTSDALLAPQSAPSASEALLAASNLVAATVSHAPTMLRKQLLQMLPAQRVPPTVVSSHVVHPMCRHWFLDPAPRPDPQAQVTLAPAADAQAASGEAAAQSSSASSIADFLSLPSGDNKPSPSKGVLASRSPRAHASSSLGPDSVTLHPCVTAVAQNAQFVFSGGYFDGSLKCHSIVHFKVEEPAQAPAAAESMMTPRHHRSPTSPSIMLSPAAAAAAPATSGASEASHKRAPIATRRTADCKPLSTVQAHHAPITAICLAQNQSILFTGDAHGSVLVWRVFTERHERSRPPLSSAPLASFPVHEGKVISLASNTYVGVAASLALDLQGTRGCELCVYSVRGGTARFIRSQLAADPETDWRMLVLTSSANIVIYGSQAGVPVLWLYSLNGQLLRTVPTGEVINVLYATPASAKTAAYEGFVVTGGRKGVVVFRSPHTLEPVQSFFCDDLFPQAVAHGLPPVPIAAPVEGAAAAAPAAAAAAAAVPKDLWDGSTDANSSRPPVPAPSAPLDSAEAAAYALHNDPLTAALVADVSLPIRMGIASFDIAPSQQHFVVALYPDVFPPRPRRRSSSSNGGEDEETEDGVVVEAPSPPPHSEGRLLLFPLPHSSHDPGMIGFYVQVGWNTLETVRDALSSRLGDTSALARERLEQVGARLQVGATKAGEKLQVAKTKILSAFSGFFGSGNKK